MIYLNAMDVIGIKTSNPVKQKFDDTWMSKLRITTRDGSKLSYMTITCTSDNIQSLNAKVVDNVYADEEE
jgi:hypothetical protein